MIIFENIYGVTLMAHLLAVFLLVGAATHNMLIVLGYARGKFGRQKQELRYLKVAFWSYLFVYVTGMIIYPAFRIYIRGASFDPAMSWCTGLFEIKEHWSAVVLALLFVYYILRKNFQPDQEKEKLWLYLPLSVIINIVIWYKTIVGAFLTHVKGSW